VLVHGDGESLQRAQILRVKGESATVALDRFTLFTQELEGVAKIVVKDCDRRANMDRLRDQTLRGDHISQLASDDAGQMQGIRMGWLGLQNAGVAGRRLRESACALMGKPPLEGFGDLCG